MPSFQRTLNLTLLHNSKDTHFTVNHMCIADLFQEHTKQDPLVWGLAEMEAVDRKQIEMSALLQPVAVPQPSSWSTKFWHMVSLFLIGVPVAGAVYGWRRRRRHPPTQPPLEIELKQVPTASALRAATPSSPPDKELFTFTGRKA